MNIRKMHVGAVVLMTGILSFIMIGCGSESGSTLPSSNRVKEEPVTRDIFAMDTVMTIQVWGKEAEKAADAAIAEIHRIDDMVSTGNQESEITRLNREKKGEVSEDTGYMLERSLELYESTQGLFDISIYPVMRSWGFTDKNFHVPQEEELSGLLDHVQANRIMYDSTAEWTEFTDSAMEIDLGGIAKGYTSDRVLQVIDSFDVDCSLINLGGNVKTLHKKLNGDLWKIAIQDPMDLEQMAGVVTCADQAVITSGGYQRYFEEDGMTYHHIIDPRTGYPADSGLISATIVSADGTLADGLSTSLFIMGLEEAHEYWSQHKDEFDTILIDKDGMIYVSGGLKDTFWSEREWTLME